MCESKIVFQNESLITKELYMEAAKLRHTNLIRYLITIFGLALIVAGYYGQFYFFVVLGMILAVFSHFSWRVIANNDYKKLCKYSNGDSWKKTIYFKSDQIIAESYWGQDNQYAYKNIKGIKANDKVCVVEFLDKRGLLFDIQQFTLGSYEGATAFMNEMYLLAKEGQ